MTTTTHDTLSPRRPAVPGAVFLIASLPVAGLLLFASVMKLMGKPPKDTEVVQHWALIVGQFAAAGLLIVCRRRPWAWSASAMVFAMFSGVALFGLVSNAKSCGCFGALQVPPAVTLTLDATVVALSVTMAWLAGAGGRWGCALAGAIVPVLVGGAMYAKHTAPPPASEFKAGGALAEAMRQAARTPAATTPPDPAASPSAGATPTTPPASPGLAPSNIARLDAGVTMTAQQAVLLLPTVADAYLKGAAAPDWLGALAAAASDTDPGRASLLFVYDPFCEVCKVYIPFMESFRSAADASGRPLRVVMLRKRDLEPFDIPDWAWPASPTALLISGGKIIHEWGGKDTPKPAVINDEIVRSGRTYLDGLAATHAPLKQ